MMHREMRLWKRFVCVGYAGLLSPLTRDHAVAFPSRYKPALAIASQHPRSGLLPPLTRGHLQPVLSRLGRGVCEAYALSAKAAAASPDALPGYCSLPPVCACSSSAPISLHTQGWHQVRARPWPPWASPSSPGSRPLTPCLRPPARPSYLAQCNPIAKLQRQCMHSDPSSTKLCLFALRCTPLQTGRHTRRGAHADADLAIGLQPGAHRPSLMRTEPTICGQREREKDLFSPLTPKWAIGIDLSAPLDFFKYMTGVSY
ncbi:hypothetical protein L7F22_063587 [Adiantum nelumboides]|nr:hypothetical protein [Adiantum nelumboides]